MAAWLAVGVGCVGESAVDLENYVGEPTSQPIINGTPASDYPEAALVDMGNYACSGALIAPRVVLTAGHCVDGMSSWTVTLPFARGQSARATGAAVFDYRTDGDYVNPDQHDVGLVFLGSGLTLDAWPVIPRTPVANGTKAIDIGRIQNGKLSRSALYQSQPIGLRDATSQGFPLDYYSTEVIEPGDSGGPVVALDSNPHAIIAVNSGAGGGTQVLARTDLLHAWIDEQVKAHGGWGGNSGGSSSGGSSSSGGTSPGGSSSSGGTSSSGGSSSSGGTSSSGGSPSCTGEVEPNDTFQDASSLGAAACGSLGSADALDWYQWSISGSTPYALHLTSSGDARLMMWKQVDGRYYRVANTTPTSSVHTSTGPGTYVVLVVSFRGAAQTYRLTLSGGSSSGGSSSGGSSSGGSSSGGSSSGGSSSGGSSSGGTAPDGAALYQAKCSSCHGALSSSDVRGATAAQIQGRHGSRYGTAAEYEAIANAL